MSSRAVEDRIRAIAASQHGVVTRGQLMEADLSRWAISRWLRAGRLRELHRGVYLVGPILPPDAREMAAVLAAGPEAFVSHGSALRLWSLERVGFMASVSGGKVAGEPERSPVEITVVGANRGNRPGILVHRVRRLDPDERTTIRGIPVTAPVRTLVDVASTLATRDLEWAMARAEREGLVDGDALRSALDRYHGRPGLPALRAVLEEADGPAMTSSEAEEQFLALIMEAGLPRPKVNVRLGRYEIDFLWGRERVAVEVDGFWRHSVRPRFEGDRRKNAWLASEGITVIRLSWRQVTNERVATAVRVGQALARAQESARRTR